MARTNLRKVKEAINLAAEAAVAQLAREREKDKTHIEEHVRSSQQELVYLTETEKRLVDFIREVFVALRTREEERVKALQKHLDDINDDGGDVIEHKAMKVIQGAKT